MIAKAGRVVATDVNQVKALCDPSAHVEMQAVRAARLALQSTDLSGCTVYASGYPCPMCQSAMYLSGVEAVYYAYSNEDGGPYDLSAARGYAELARPLEVRHMKLTGLPVRPAARTCTKPGTSWRVKGGRWADRACCQRDTPVRRRRANPALVAATILSCYSDCYAAGPALAATRAQTIAKIKRIRE